MDSVIKKIYHEYYSTREKGQIIIGLYHGYEIKIVTLNSGAFRLVDYQITNMKNGENKGKSSPVYTFYDNQLKNALEVTSRQIDARTIENGWESDVKYTEYLNTNKSDERSI